jgi:cysteine desulfuration protein SufE
MSQTIESIEKEIVKEFSVFGTWLDKYKYLIELGKNMPVLDEKNKNPLSWIRGCQSNVWIHSEFKDGKVFFSGDSDTIIMKGVIALLIRVLSGQTPDSVIVPN